MHNNFAEKLILPENSFDYQHTILPVNQIEKAQWPFQSLT